MPSPEGDAMKETSPWMRSASEYLTCLHVHILNGSQGNHLVCACSRHVAHWPFYRIHISLRTHL